LPETSDDVRLTLAMPVAAGRDARPRVPDRRLGEVDAADRGADVGCSNAPVPPDSVEPQISPKALEPVNRTPVGLPSKFELLMTTLSVAVVPPVVPKDAPIPLPRKIELWICTVPVLRRAR
jgi:hypothetical protein